MVMVIYLLWGTKLTFTNCENKNIRRFILFKIKKETIIGKIGF